MKKNLMKPLILFVLILYPALSHGQEVWLESDPYGACGIDTECPVSVTICELNIVESQQITDIENSGATELEKQQAKVNLCNDNAIVSEHPVEADYSIRYNLGNWPTDRISYRAFYIDQHRRAGYLSDPLSLLGISRKPMKLSLEIRNLQ
jgi:hypothetical protein